MNYPTFLSFVKIISVVCVLTIAILFKLLSRRDVSEARGPDSVSPYVLQMYAQKMIPLI